MSDGSTASALLTDLYQLTMAAGYHAAGKQHEIATFEMFVRRLPEGRTFLFAAGLAQALEYLANLRFTEAEIEYLQTLPQFARAAPEFWSYLRDFRFTGSVFAMREGTVFHAGEPILTVRAPIIEAQIVETYLLATIAFQTTIATKAALMCEAAAGVPVVEFGTRRAHSPEAGTLGARAAFIGGCVGTSNVLAGMRYGIPVYGTSAHSWVLSFESEREAFARMQQLLGEGTVHLIDTYETLEGARIAAQLGEPIWGVRIDSGDLAALTFEVRRILDAAGLTQAKIMLTGDLDEAKIRAILAAGAPANSFGVGTSLATSSDAPALGAVYKLVEHQVGDQRRYPSKSSPGKATVGHAKQVFRYADHDCIGAASDCPAGDCAALLEPVMLEGALTEPLPTAAEAREYAARQERRARPVEWSPRLA